MGMLKTEYKSFLDDLEKNIKNKEDLEYIKKRFASFVDVMLTQMDYIMDYKEEEMKKLQQSQNEIQTKVDKMQQILDNIEKDIYSDDGFDFEIICPYCNYQFIIDVDEDKKEVECPECHNIIELDWTGNVDDDGDNCGDCDSCPGCGGDFPYDDDSDEDDM